MMMRRKKPEVSKKVESFTRETTFHGVKYIFNGEARIARRWVICSQKGIEISRLFRRSILQTSFLFLAHLISQFRCAIAFKS